MKYLSVAFIAMVLVSACVQVPGTGKMKFKNQADSVSYALGYIEAKEYEKGLPNLPFDTINRKGLAKVLSESDIKPSYSKFRTEQFEEFNPEAFRKGIRNIVVLRGSP